MTPKLRTREKCYLQNLPSEMLGEIISYLPSDDRVSFELVSRTMYAHMDLAEAPTAPPTLTQLARVQTRIEANTPRSKALQYLTCTLCCKLKTIKGFSTAQWRRTNYQRFCIKCGIHNRRYLGRLFKAQGKKSFGCVSCERACPVEDEYTGVPSIDLSQLKEFCGLKKGKGKWCKFCGDHALDYGARYATLGYSFFRYTGGRGPKYHLFRYVFRKGRLQYQTLKGVTGFPGR